jgi:arylsulfatase A-like enzyme
MRAYYCATISFVDYQVGRVLAALEDAGTLDDTLVMFSSDHGELLGDYGCFGKRSMHDPSSRVPLLVRYPRRFRAGTRCATAVSLVDVMPTLLESAGAAWRDRGLDGIDLADVAAGRTPADRTVYAQYEKGATGLYMAVNRRRKYVWSAGDAREFLFDREADPRETVNLADAKGGAAADLAAMRADLLAFLERTGETDAFERSGGAPAWRRYEPTDESYLNDPEAKLLVQDYPPPEMAELNRQPGPAERYAWLARESDGRRPH